jgi:hypothetical protein
MQTLFNNGKSELSLLSRLPIELRRAIWRFCLPPKRVEELDSPYEEFAFYMERSAGSADCPCKVSTTSVLNGHLPVISRVCFEAREVALEAAKPVAEPEVAAPGHCVQTATNSYREAAWQGRERAAVLMNWDPQYLGLLGGADEQGDLTEPLRCLEWELSRSDSEQVGAFSAGYLDYDYGDIIPDISVPY